MAIETMEFIMHTLNWTRGEIFEGICIAAFGCLVIILGFAFWKFGQTLNAKALFMPFVVVGVLSLATGVSMVVSNQRRLVDYKKDYNLDAAAFVQQEKVRVEGFQYMYTTAKIMVTFFFLMGIMSLWLSQNRHLHAVGIALMVCGVSLVVIDYFSKERADTYYEIIMQEIK